MVAEENIISEMLSNPSIVPEVAGVLEPQMFKDALLGKMFFEIVKANHSGLALDIEHLAQRLGTEFPDNVIKTELANIVANGALSIYYKTDMQTVFNDYNARKLNDLLSKTMVDGSNVYEQLEKLRSGIDSITCAESSSRSVKDITEDFKDKYFKPHERPLMKTGFRFLDDLLGGLESGDMVAIGARPAVGKSAFGLQMASQMADSGFKVQVFNLEMTEKQIYERLTSYEGGLSLQRLRVAECFKTEEERVRFDNANAKLVSRTNLIISTGSKSVSDIRKETKFIKPDIVVIDYLQLLKPDSNYKGNRYAEVGAISHAIKALAIEQKIPVVVLTQLNRVSDGAKEPSMAEIRESGDVEQDAGVIILLWNKNLDDKTQKGCKVEKNRNGETGKVDLVFNGSEMRFEEPDGNFSNITTEQEEELPFSPSNY